MMLLHTRASSDQRPTPTSPRPFAAPAGPVPEGLPGAFCQLSGSLNREPERTEPTGRTRRAT